mmetsp:Transcript_54719/g.132387  ORF Transcript_54719/g.132387 Transcript_54719/m.132387 type:complete len:209 (+) Transcript_54719:80-706(+)
MPTGTPRYTQVTGKNSPRKPQRREASNFRTRTISWRSLQPRSFCFSWTHRPRGPSRSRVPCRTSRWSPSSSLPTASARGSILGVAPSPPTPQRYRSRHRGAPLLWFPKIPTLPPPPTRNRRDDGWCLPTKAPWGGLCRYRRGQCEGPGGSRGAPSTVVRRAMWHTAATTAPATRVTTRGVIRKERVVGVGEVEGGLGGRGMGGRRRPA